jgi:bacterioferritin (cytochrome b1)
MKKLIKLICEKIKTEISVKKVLRNNLYKQDKLLITFAQAIVELREVVDKVKETNFKDIYLEEHERFKDLEKENRKLKKEIKKYEKDNKTTNN